MKSRSHLMQTFPLAVALLAISVAGCAAAHTTTRTTKPAANQTATSPPTTQSAAITAPVTPMTPNIVRDYEPLLSEADFTKRVEMIPMRDGVKLYTVIFMKKGTHD